MSEPTDTENLTLPILKNLQMQMSEMRAQLVDLDVKIDVKIDQSREELSSEIESLGETMESRFDLVQDALMDNASHRKTTNQYVLTTSERHEADIADLQARVAELESEAKKAKG